MSALFVASGFAQNILGPTNSTWNYDLQGTDWSAYSYCAGAYFVEAPIDISNIQQVGTADFKTYMAYDWSIYSYSFLPDFASGDATWYGFEQWVYQVYGSWGGLYAAEPSKSTVNRVVYWDSFNIRFHYPSEHTLNGTTYALEMQIFGKDLYARHLLCYGGSAALSILFEVDTTGDSHPFFDW